MNEVQKMNKMQNQIKYKASLTDAIITIIRFMEFKNMNVFLWYWFLSVHTILEKL
jgi:hypothetical protein